jgi:hypothetical protein
METHSATAAAALYLKLWPMKPSGQQYHCTAAHHRRRRGTVFCQLRTHHCDVGDAGLEQDAAADEANTTMHARNRCVTSVATFVDMTMTAS